MDLPLVRGIEPQRSDRPHVHADGFLRGVQRRHRVELHTLVLEPYAGFPRHVDDGRGHVLVVQPSADGMVVVEIDPVGVAGLGQQFLGEIGVIVVSDDLIGRVADVARLVDALHHVRVPAKDVLHDRVDVHRMVDRFAHQRVVGRRDVGIEEAEHAAKSAGGADVGRPLHAVDQLGRQRGDEIGLDGIEQRHARRALGLGTEGDGPDLRLGPPVSRIPLELDVHALLPFHEPVGAAADRLPAEARLAARLGIVLGREEEEKSGRCRRRRIRAIGHEVECERVDRHHFLDMVHVAGGHPFVALEGLHAELRDFRIDFFAVGEFESWTEVEAPAVGRPALPPVAQTRLQLHHLFARVVPVLRRALEDVRVDVAGVDVRVHRRVERLRPGGLDHRQGPPGARRRLRHAAARHQCAARTRGSQTQELTATCLVAVHMLSLRVGPRLL